MIFITIGMNFIVTVVKDTINRSMTTIINYYDALLKTGNENTRYTFHPTPSPPHDQRSSSGVFNFNRTFTSPPHHMLSVACVACSNANEREHPHPTPPHPHPMISIAAVACSTSTERSHLHPTTCSASHAWRVQMLTNVNIPTPPHPIPTPWSA